MKTRTIANHVTNTFVCWFSLKTWITSIGVLDVRSSNFNFFNCGAIKQNESGIWAHHIFSFLLGVIFYSKSYILQKTPFKLDMSFQSYDMLKGCRNNRKQKDLFSLFGSISKSIFANSDSFCLIIPQFMNINSNGVHFIITEISLHLTRFFATCCVLIECSIFPICPHSLHHINIIMLHKCLHSLCYFECKIMKIRQIVRTKIQ